MRNFLKVQLLPVFISNGTIPTVHVLVCDLGRYALAPHEELSDALRRSREMVELLRLVPGSVSSGDTELEGVEGRCPPNRKKELVETSRNKDHIEHSIRLAQTQASEDTVTFRKT